MIEGLDKLLKKLEETGNAITQDETKKLSEMRQRLI